MADQNPYLLTMEQEAQRVRALPPGSPDPIGTFLEEQERKQRMQGAQQAAALYQASSISPDQAGQQARIAQRLGVPVAAVAAIPEEMAVDAQLREVQANSARSATLQRRFTDADFARLARDDSAALAGVGDSIAAIARYVMGADRGTGMPQDLAAGMLYDMSRGAAGGFRAFTEVLAPLLDFTEGRAPGGNPLRRLAEGFAIRGAQAKARADELSPPQEGLIRGGIQSGIRSAGLNAGLLPIALPPALIGCCLQSPAGVMA
ncbi:MAG: hypothetical protein U1F67_10445 [Rubrivivax sp.]